MNPGTLIEVAAGQIGLWLTPEGTPTDAVAQAGARGRYLSTHPEMDDWHVIAVVVDGDVYFAPVATKHIREVPVNA